MDESGKSFVLVGYIGWCSAVVLLWLVLANRIAAHWGLLVFAFCFFVFMGFVGMAMSMPRKK